MRTRLCSLGNTGGCSAESEKSVAKRDALGTPGRMQYESHWKKLHVVTWFGQRN